MLMQGFRNLLSKCLGRWSQFSHSNHCPKNIGMPDNRPCTAQVGDPCLPEGIGRTPGPLAGLTCSSGLM